MSPDFRKLRNKLAELFQLDAAAELDFGIYRILNARRTEVEQFLNGLEAQAAAGGTHEAHTRDIFSRLATFFSRYYKDGDFLARGVSGVRQQRGAGFCIHPLAGFFKCGPVGGGVLAAKARRLYKDRPC